MKEYKIVTCHPDRIEQTLNAYASSGWTFRTFVAGDWSKITILMDRDNRNDT